MGLNKFVSILSLVILFFVNGCVPKTNTHLHQVTVSVQAPPAPPTPRELEKPPNLVLEKPGRDPFMTLGGEGSSAGIGGEGEKAGSKSAGGNFVISGIMTGGSKYSAILESGTMSYIVHPGDKVGGYQVSSITAKTVVLVRGKEKIVLTLAQ